MNNALYHTNETNRIYQKLDNFDFKNESEILSINLVKSMTNSRPDSAYELKRNNIYKKAEVIKNVTLANPKFNRLSDSLTKVFGLSDPPPGFGFCYPRYYYLEQKRPQPMTPLKVWRGFNGNIYFEPMILNNMNQIVEIDKIKEKEIEKKSNNKIINKTKIKLDINQTKTKNQSIDFTTNLNDYNPNISQDNNFINKKKEDFEDKKKYPEISKDINQNEFSQYRNFKRFYSKSLDIKRKKSPIKGLAFRDAKKVEDYSKEYSKNEDKIQSEINSYNNVQDDELRPSYKEMVKRIRKGINSYKLQDINLSSVVYNNPNLNEFYGKNRKTSLETISIKKI